MQSKKRCFHKEPVFFVRKQTVVLLLCGGDKSSQQEDIHRAQQMARTL